MTVINNKSRSVHKSDIEFFLDRDKRIRKLERTIDLCRSYFAGADLCYCEIGECEPCSNLRAKAENAIKNLDGEK